MSINTSKPIKVLHVLDILSRGSGVTSVFMNYLRNIDTSKFIFDVVVHKNGDESLKKEIEYLGGTVYNLPDITISGFPRYKIEFSQILKNNKYQILHGHISNAAFLYMTEAKKQHVPIRIIHSHNGEAASTLFKRVRNSILERNIKKWCNYYFACSDKAADRLFKDIASEEIVILPNAINTKDFEYNSNVRKQVRDSFGINQKTFCIGHIGRFDQQKNHQFLLEILAGIKEKEKDCLLLLIGTGDLEPQIKRYAVNLGLDKDILFLGQRSDCQRLYQAFDIFVLPSIFEGLPLVGVEAQTSGLPCLFSENISKQIEITDNVWFLPIDDSLVWAEKAISIFKNYFRLDQSIVVSEKGFDIKNKSHELENIYMKYINNIGVS